LPLRTLLFWPDKFGYRSGIAKLGTLEAIIADNYMVYIFMLKNDSRYAGFHADAAVGAFFFDDNICAVLALINGAFGANLHAFSALGADSRLINPRLRELSLDSQGGFLDISGIEMADSANLGA
jgi:hypothetical protein